MKARSLLLKNEGYEFVFKEIRRNTNTLSSKYDELYEKVWNEFVDGLIIAFRKAFAKQENDVVVKIISTKPVRQVIYGLVEGKYSISCDPYIICDFNVGVSRIFNPGENVHKRIGGRPGYRELSDQMQDLSSVLDRNRRSVLIEDDIFTGSTIAQILEDMRRFGIEIHDILVGFQIGNTTRITQPIESIFKFNREDVLDINDIRNLVIGGFESGLVIKYPQGKIKAPYILPFCSPQARSSIPQNQMYEFSIDVTLLNENLYNKISKIVRKSVTLNEVNPFFQKLMLIEGANREMTMSQIFNIILRTVSNQERNSIKRGMVY